LDKWLWAARFFKTRSQAALAITSGRVQVNEQRPKPRKTVAPGDVITIRKDELRWTIVVRATTVRRGPASQAAELYEESEESRAERKRMTEQRRAEATVAAVKGWRTGRPSKRDRRRMERFRRSEESFD
jgi:ribosome-associated heat shock protein Hsp15